MRETARDHTPMTALPYYHVAARAVPAITATPCGGYPPEKSQTDTLMSKFSLPEYERNCWSD